jgi:hypothetical protein
MPASNHRSAAIVPPWADQRDPMPRPGTQEMVREVARALGVKSGRELDI